ncbi:MAG: OadG family protein [Ruminococcus sp.]|nr:OadG family protein [Ruminococcus sp.]
MNFFTLAVQTADSGTKISIGDAAVTAIFGYCVVFFGLVLLMCVLYATGAIFQSRDEKDKAAKKADATKSAETKPAVPEKKPEPVFAKGSAGHIKLHNVPDKEAAMIMAIIADKMQTPLNELHFISIKEVSKK